MTNIDAKIADYLLTPEAVRAQCRAILALGLDDRLAHFSVNRQALSGTAVLVSAVIRENYPSLHVPPHARWRHFMIDGRDRSADILARAGDDRGERARIACELAITSVLLDAGAGPLWTYRDARSGRALSRSEGLALASLDAYASGAFSADKARPLRADAAGLAAFTTARLAAAFQVTPENPLDGLDGRAALIVRLAESIIAAPQIFGTEDPRLGNIADHLASRAVGGKLEARTILTTVLQALGGIWPGRTVLAGRNLGDTWAHPQAGKFGLVPFHKLSQWLAYSLFEPVQALGIAITGAEALTGLAEYRNGGLFIDTGVLTLRDPAAALEPQPPGAALIVEWRALTVALLDETAILLRATLGLSEAAMPLASVLEGGTWAAGRRIAREKRAGGVPPIAIVSDGSVF